MRVWALLSVCAMVACGPCGYGAGRRQADAGRDAGPPRTETPAAAELQMGIVEGVVRLGDGAELPMANPEASAVGAARPAGCSAPTDDDRRPVRLGEGRGLEGMLVSASGFHGSPPHEPRTITVSIRD